MYNLQYFLSLLGDQHEPASAKKKPLNALRSQRLHRGVQRKLWFRVEETKSIIRKVAVGRRR